MKDIATKLLEQGLPTLLFVLAAFCLVLGFFEIASVSPFSYIQRLYAPLVVVALVLLLVAIGLWFIDKKKPPDAESSIDGHVVLIRLLTQFSHSHGFHVPGDFASVVVDGGNSSVLAERAARYGAMYLHTLGLLEPNNSGSEYRSSAKADALLKKNDFRARNAGAFVHRGV